MPSTQQPTMTDRGQRKTRLGLVVSNKMMKTISVQVVQLFRHPKYARVIKRSSTFKAHDETNSASPGDWVRIAETRPLSKDKRWRLVEIIKRVSNAPPLPQAEGVLATPPGAGQDVQDETRAATTRGEAPSGSSKRTKARKQPE